MLKTSLVFWLTTELADFERELQAALAMQRSGLPAGHS